MKYLPIMLSLFISGCGGTNISVVEDSVIPTIRLAEAHSYFGECVADRITEGSRIEVENMINDCTDNMFILFANSSYMVSETTRYGDEYIVCVSDSIADINRCLM